MNFKLLNQLSPIRKSAVRPILLLCFYLMHTTVFCMLSSVASNHSHHFFAKIAKQSSHKSKPYSFSATKHVPLKQKSESENQVILIAMPLQIPSTEVKGLNTTNLYTYRLPDDSYKRYRVLRSILI